MFFLYIFFILNGLVIPTHVSANNELTVDITEAKAQASTGWSTYRAHSVFINGTCSDEFYRISMNESTFVSGTDFAYWKKGEMFRFDQQFKGNYTHGLISLINKDMSCTFMKKSPDSKWAMTGRSTPDHPEELKQLIPDLFSNSSVCRGLYVIDIPIEKLFAIPGINFTSATYVAGTSNQLVEMSFVLDQSPPNYTSIRSGSITMKPLMAWQISSYKINIELVDGSKGVKFGDNKYILSPSDYYLFSNQETKLVKAETNQILAKTITIANFQDVIPPSDEVFTLTSIGISEMKQSKNRSFQFMVYLFLGLLFATISNFLYWIRLKSSSRAQSLDDRTKAIF